MPVCSGEAPANRAGAIGIEPRSANRDAGVPQSAGAPARRPARPVTGTAPALVWALEGTGHAVGMLRAARGSVGELFGVRSTVVYHRASTIARVGERVPLPVAAPPSFASLRRASPRLPHMTGSQVATIAMIPSSQPQASKRKATDDANPLAATAGKKLKREVRSTNTCILNAHIRHLGHTLILVFRALKLDPRTNANVSAYNLYLGASCELTSHGNSVNGEEQPGGLVIVRAPAPSSRTLHIEPLPPETRAPSRPPSVPPPSKPPAKKLRADGSSRSVGKSKDRDVYAAPRAEPEVDEDVRQMQSETDTLRRRSQAAGSLNGAADVQFPPRTPGRRTVDTTEPLAQAETPQIEKNKAMRGEGSAGSGHRRRSSVSRGKRISSSYEATGVICE